MDTNVKYNTDADAVALHITPLLLVKNRHAIKSKAGINKVCFGSIM